MPKYFKKLFLVLLAGIIMVTSTVPSNAIAASKPGRPSFKVIKRAKKSVTLKINKTKNATGYQIFIANSKNGKYKQVAASRIRTVKLTKLKKDKVYYVKIRAFKTVGWHITLGKFSKIIKINKYGKKKKPLPDVPEESSQPEEPSQPEESSQPEEPSQPEESSQPEEPSQDVVSGPAIEL